MKNTIGLLLIFSCAAHATTKISDPNVRSPKAHCELRANFLGAKGVKLTGGPGREAQSENAVYWDLEVIDGPSPMCPKDRNISVRVRAASFSGKILEPVITYPIDIREPPRDQAFRLHIKSLRGKDTFLNRNFSEWTLIERLDD